MLVLHPPPEYIQPIYCGSSQLAKAEEQADANATERSVQAAGRRCLQVVPRPGLADGRRRAPAWQEATSLPRRPRA